MSDDNAAVAQSGEHLPRKQDVGGSTPPGRAAFARVICAWCGDMKSDGPLPESHGLCDACKRNHFGGE